MENISFIGFKVSKYRSLMSVEVSTGKDNPVVICGENNIGKTNFLRALNVFFNHHKDETLFVPSRDIPHHIYNGSRGKGLNTELEGYFYCNEDTVKISVVFEGIEGNINYKLNGADCSVNDALSWIDKFKFLFIESSNIDLPKLMSNMLEEDALRALDNKRSKQARPLKKLQEFIELSQKAISDIEKQININFQELTDFDGVLQNKSIKIEFAEYEKLRDIVKNMTSITLFDGNNSSIATKGSGAQRAVFIALMKYIAKNTKENVVWGIDEPEVFLQPRLQKKFRNALLDIVKIDEQPVFITTHSQHFIDLNFLDDTHLFKGEINEKIYARKPGEIFYETTTKPIDTVSNFEKSVLIRDHLGIVNNDGWEVLPYNVIVEGEEDKKYLEALFASIQQPAPNIIWSGGASKIGGYLQYYEIFAQDLSYKPSFLCVFDNDAEGRQQLDKINPKKYKYIDVDKRIITHSDGRSRDPKNDWEVEDFLPISELAAVINRIARKAKYSVIKQAQISDKSKPAHKQTQVLKYFESCLAMNNSDKNPIVLDDEGRKRQICVNFCEQELKELTLNEHQLDFLKNLSKE